MPIIQDPRQNPRERLYGIIEVNGVYCYYDKENKRKKKRFMPMGFFVSSDLITLKDDRNPNNVILFNGKDISIKAEFDLPEDYNVDADPRQGPIVKGMFKWADTGTGGLRELVDNGTLPSDLPNQ